MVWLQHALRGRAGQKHGSHSVIIIIRHSDIPTVTFSASGTGFPDFDSGFDSIYDVRRTQQIYKVLKDIFHKKMSHKYAVYRALHICVMFYTKYCLKLPFVLKSAKLKSSRLSA